MNAISTRKKPLLSVVGQPAPFNAIQKVCAILRVLAQNSPLRLTEIAEATSLNKATTLRILGSLIEEGFVCRGAGAQTYEVAPPRVGERRRSPPPVGRPQRFMGGPGGGGGGGAPPAAPSISPNWRSRA